MLPSSARLRFSEWPKFSAIIVYDVDSTGLPHLREGNNILGLLRKFAKDAAYTGNALLWFKGGFQRVWRERRDLVDLGSPEPEAEDDANDSGSLKTNQLPSSAFGSGTTTRNSQVMSSPQKRPLSSTSLRANAPSMFNEPDISSSILFNPFFNTIRQNIELSHVRNYCLSYEYLPILLPRVLPNVFHFVFQNVFAGGLTTFLLNGYVKFPGMLMSSLKPQDVSSSNGGSSPTLEQQVSLKQNSTLPPPHQTLLDEGMEVLAMQFYRIELVEQRQLMGVMKHHSEESRIVGSLKEAVPEASIESRSGSLSSQENAFPPASTSVPKLALSRVSTTGSDSSLSQSPPPSALAAGSSAALSSLHPRKTNKPNSLSSRQRLFFSELDSDRGNTHKPSQSGRKADPFPYSITAGVEKVSLPSLKHSTVTASPSPRPPSGALTGPITFLLGSGGAAITCSPSDATHSPRSSWLKARQGLKPSFGAGELSFVSSPAFKFSSSALTAPALTGLDSSTIGGSALKPSFTNMRVPAPQAGTGGETTESEYEHDNSEREASGRDKSKPAEEYDDYVNALYIATQGPLEATFTDFWILIYQQNVHVVVMLTREIEGAMVKCSPYWKDEVFGPL
ncbi:hypothetical protein GYMLUDRAFT_65297 [Collybiopsis luxurians FD-317 M1]|uniref:Tyrosine-protein phosphatase domain-containing protein n=1 Tax=Collybiopsis luxurians FD-317 M1 TaxID=944289 RepID=A0A0D0BYA2_9AGAR|nr:hypothetical protein GYMLUDRAFT_65297 [Collybiopsis luxurians FD-317 M1]